MTGTGQKIKVHDRKSCSALIDNSLESCVIHAPSNHIMRAFPTHWREDRRIMERICPHGIGHPDPDDMNYIYATQGGEESRNIASMHGCDGCCIHKEEA